jgi:hypothetical protein
MPGGTRFGALTGASRLEPAARCAESEFKELAADGARPALSFDRRSTMSVGIRVDGSYGRSSS